MTNKHAICLHEDLIIFFISNNIYGNILREISSESFLRALFISESFTLCSTFLIILQIKQPNTTFIYIFSKQYQFLPNFYPTFPQCKQVCWNFILDGIQRVLILSDMNQASSKKLLARAEPFLEPDVQFSLFVEGITMSLVNTCTCREVALLSIRSTGLIHFITNSLWFYLNIK